ncbi:MAG: HVO_A0114 family putative DNA-binding protein [Promethearchaeota archaeon]|jgi:predicted transcriptional regulator
MKWRVLKQVPLMEVQRRIEELENIYGSLSYLHAEFSKGRMPPGKFDDYIEWTGMSHALRAYQEGESLEFQAEQDLDLDPEEYQKITPKRLELLDHLMKAQADSINELANNAGRDVKNVYNDLKILEDLGFVSLIKEGRNTRPEPLVQEVTILLG